MTENDDTHRDRHPATEIPQQQDEIPDQASYERPLPKMSFHERELAPHSTARVAHNREGDNTGSPRRGRSKDRMYSPKPVPEVFEESQPREHVSMIYNLPRPEETSLHRSEGSIIKAHYDEALRAKDREVADLRHEVQRLRAATSELEQQLHGRRKDLDAAQGQISHISRQLEEEHHRRQGGENELRKLKVLLDDRTEEVKVAQAFMTCADKYSVAEVSQMVEQLNDEIYQCAMDLSDVVLEQSAKPSGQRRGEEWGKRLEAARHTLRRWNQDVLARVEADLLKDDPDTTLLECMVQYVFTTRCRDIIRAFCSQDKIVDNYLCDLWEEVASSHETAIARNWLAITQAGTKVQLQPPDRGTILTQLGSLITLSGRETPAPTWLEDFINPKLDEMDSKAAKVKEAIAEGVLSVDAEVFAHGRGLPFKATDMRDAFEKPGKARGAEKQYQDDQIVCSTGLGMRRITRVPRASDPSTMRRKREVILKTKVLMYSTLIE